MSINIDDLVWEVTGLKTKNEVNHEGTVLPNVVCQTYWKATYIDADGNKGIFPGATPFSAANLSAEQFEQFDTLTEEVVLGWIKSITVGDYFDVIVQQIQNQINEQTLTVPAMPWVAES